MLFEKMDNAHYLYFSENIVHLNLTRVIQVIDHMQPFRQIELSEITWPRQSDCWNTNGASPLKRMLSRLAK